MLILLHIKILAIFQDFDNKKACVFCVFVMLLDDFEGLFFVEKLKLITIVIKFYKIRHICTNHKKILQKLT